MTPDYPLRIAGSIRLPTGDQVDVTAFLVGLCQHGWTQYEVAWPDGSPLELGGLDLERLHLRLDMIPAHAAVAIRLYQ